MATSVAVIASSDGEGHGNLSGTADWPVLRRLIEYHRLPVLAVKERQLPILPLTLCILARFSWESPRSGFL